MLYFDKLVPECPRVGVFYLVAGMFLIYRESPLIGGTFIGLGTLTLYKVGTRNAERPVAQNR